MIIVTGGAGFIGSAFVWRLNQAGMTDVILVDDLYTSLKWKNLVGLRFRDMMSKDVFLSHIQSKTLPFSHSNIEAVVHLGACSSTTMADGSYL